MKNVIDAMDTISLIQNLRNAYEKWYIAGQMNKSLTVLSDKQDSCSYLPKGSNEQNSSKL